MASVNVSSEFMTNMVSGGPAPVFKPGPTNRPGNNGRQFHNVMDENDRHMVIGLSDDENPRLEIIRHNEHDAQHVLNLGACFDIPDNAPIQAFQVLQDFYRTLYLAFAYSTSSTTSQVVLAKPFAPDSLVHGAKLETVEGDSTQFESVDQIVMTPIMKHSHTPTYPLVVLVHKLRNQPQTWSEFTTQILTNDSFSKWSAMKTFGTFKRAWEILDPPDTTGIIQIVPATFDQFHGIAVLYKKEDGTMQIIGNFLYLHGKVALDVTRIVKCPQGKSLRPHGNESLAQKVVDGEKPGTAMAIASVGDISAATMGIYISTADGIYYSRFHLVGTHSRDPILVSGDADVRGCQSMEITQYRPGRADSLTTILWFTNEKGDFGYMLSSPPGEPEPNHPIPNPKTTLILPAGEAVYTAPMTIPPPKDRKGDPIGPVWNSVILAKTDGNLGHLEQASDTRRWLDKPFYLHHDEGLYEVRSYSTTIKVLHENGSPLADTPVRISSSSAVTGYLNGKNVTLNPDSAWYKTDVEGALSFIIPTTSMASPIMTIAELELSDKKVSIDRVFDPSKKVVDRLHDKIQGIETIDDMKKLKTQQNEPLFNSENMPSDEHLQAALGHLKLLKSFHQELPPNGTVKTGNPQHGDPIPPPGGFLDFVEDAFHYVVKKVQEVVHWVVQKADDAVHFICHVANKVFEFVVNTVEKAVHVATWVWNKIKIGWDELRDFVGFIFEWDDIIRTKDQVSALVTSGIDYAASKAVKFETTIEEALDKWLEDVTDYTPPDDIKASAHRDADESPLEVLLSDTATAWMGERLKNGGMLMPSPIDDSDWNPDHLATNWWKKAQEPLTRVITQWQNIAQIISDLWAVGQSLSAKKATDNLKEFRNTAITMLRKLVYGLIDAVNGVFTMIKNYGTTEIKIPVISGLYKKLTGHSLTVFGAIAFITAVPTAVITKIVIQSAPPIIKNLNGDLLGRLLGLEGEKEPRSMEYANTSCS
ncbi:hypothetical protein P168DRAFT_163712 [Aspergillus campestris IBT 28561]|uniref:Uncharacterized protein n=1 Tax=Aspergillus campestris (strain IBT 28561) TaxID=1392248 RepID=A0A2I1D0W1_ASPC2|nr:uncharacterized protein P168DRAFT_163712 [Aspergillus campestris IBT 28561]PKY03502.1 hypothetical protein P168DRAFT_163712 [Aspergillus campestris IBT 28561]